MLFMSCVFHAFPSVHCCPVVTCWERAWLLLVMFNCVFVTLPCGILGQVWYLIVSIPDLCCLSYFNNLLKWLRLKNHLVEMVIGYPTKITYMNIMC